MEVAAQQNTLCPAKPFCPATTFHGSATVPFVIPSEAEGSAVLRTSPGNVWRGLLFRRFVPHTHYSESHVRWGITGRMGFLGLSLLGHLRIARDRLALSQGLEQNPPHPAANLSSLARVVLCRRPLHAVDSNRFASRHPGRPVAGRPYDTASDTDVGCAAAPASGRANGSPAARPPAICPARRPRPVLPYPGPASRVPPAHSPCHRIPGDEPRLHRL